MNFDISGAKIFFRIPTHLPILGDIVVSETVVVSWLVMLIITGLCIFLTRGLKVEHIGKRQALAELIVESLVGLRSPTADLSVEAAWALTVFTMITANKIKAGGLLGYLKGFTTPIPVMTPFNILSEIATPISMACRHFGNVLSGVVINGLIYAALGVASAALFGLIPGAVGDFLSRIPILAVGLPAIMSFYFDWFSGIMQAFIFTMLTIMYIANAAEG